MEARAKVTSKGQVTIPADVRRALEIAEGDQLVFEVAGQYATIRKRRPVSEVSAELRERYPRLREPRPITDREAIGEYFDEEYRDCSDGGTLYVSLGDGRVVTHGAEDPVVPGASDE